MTYESRQAQLEAMEAHALDRLEELIDSEAGTVAVAAIKTVLSMDQLEELRREQDAEDCQWFITRDPVPPSPDDEDCDPWDKTMSM